MKLKRKNISRPIWLNGYKIEGDYSFLEEMKKDYLLSIFFPFLSWMFDTNTGFCNYCDWHSSLTIKSKFLI